MAKSIRNLIIEEVNKLILERVTITNLPTNIVMLSKDLSPTEAKLLLYDTITEQPIGYISFGYVDDADVFSVFGAFSQKGFGPFLYESAMTYAYPKGCCMSRDSSTSGDAVAVWEKFAERSDVKKERINYQGSTEKADEFYTNGETEEYKNRVLELEDTRFFYSYGKDTLNKLIQQGNEYQAKADIDDEDIEHMSWDLED